MISKKRYMLIQDLPDIPRGVTFAFIKNDKEYSGLGNIEDGVMVFKTPDNHNYIFPGKVSKNKKWFLPITIEE